MDSACPARLHAVVSAGGHELILSNGALLPSQIDTIADRTPIFSDANYYNTTALELTGIWAAYGALYRNQLWVNTVIRKLAFGTARLPFDVKDQAGDSNSQSPHVGPLADLLARPNDRLDSFRLWLWTSATFDIYGEAFWLKVRDDTGRVRELHPMNPTNVIVRRDPNTGGIFYLYTAGVRSTTLLPPIPAADVVPFLAFNPDDLPRGMSNLEPLRQTLLNEDAIRRANASWWKRGARPSVVLRHPNTLSAGAQTRIKTGFDDAQAGVDNMGGSTVLEEGMDLTIVQLNAEEMQYIESRKLNRGEVCAAYDVPPPVVHILDNATYSNITEQMRSMYRDTMAPRFSLFESAVRHHLVPDFDSTGTVFVRFNMNEVLRGDFEVRATAAIGLVTSGIMKPSEARPMFDLPDGGVSADLLYANAAMVPLGTPAKRVTITEPVAGASTIAAAESSAEGAAPAGKSYALRSILGRVGSAQTKAAARSALVDEHQTQLSGFFDGQKSAAVADPGSFDPADWDDELAAILSTLGEATAKDVGGRIAKDLGGAYSVDDIRDWLDKNSKTTASLINKTTADQITAALDAAVADGVDPSEAIDGLFSGEVAARASQISATRVAVVGGLAMLASARQNSASTKTWVVTSNKPRASHAAMSGETVPLGEYFSNGMDGPGDYSGGAGEVAGCTCELDFSREDQ